MQIIDTDGQTKKVEKRFYNRIVHTGMCSKRYLRSHTKWFMHHERGSSIDINEFVLLTSQYIESQRLDNKESKVSSITFFVIAV